MTKKQFKVYYARYRSVIAAIARKLGGRDDELVEDLEQEGAFALFLFEPDTARSNPDSCLRQALKFRMIDHLRRYNPALYESLDVRLQAGDQVEKDPDSGEMVLRPVFGPVPRLGQRYEGSDEGEE